MAETGPILERSRCLMVKSFSSALRLERAMEGILPRWRCSNAPYCFVSDSGDRSFARRTLRSEEEQCSADAEWEARSHRCVAGREYAARQLGRSEYGDRCWRERPRCGRSRRAFF